MALAVARRERGTRASRVVGAVAGVLLVVCLILGIWDLSRERRMQIQRLPDKTLASFVTVTYGKYHSCSLNTGWQRVVGAMFPTQRQLASNSFNRTTSYDALLVWWRLELPGKPASWSNISYQAPCDEHGCRFARSQSDWVSTDFAKTGAVVAEELSTFPRREPTFGLGIFNQWDRRQWAKFIVRNPLYQRYPIWKPEPYPIRRRNGRVELTLLDLAHDQHHMDNRSGARFRITEEGSPTTLWEPARFTVEDATGNRVASGVEKFGSDKRAWFDGLCTHETAWKIRTTLMPAYPVRVPPDLSWEIRDLAVPAPDQVTLRNAGLRRKGVALQFLMLSASRAPKGDPLRVRAAVGMPQAEEGDCLTLLRVKDERGRDLSASAQGGPFAHMDGGASQAYFPPKQAYSFNLRLPPRTKRLNLTFVLHRMKPFEFLAKP